MIRTRNRKVLKTVLVALAVMFVFAFTPLTARSTYAATTSKAKTVKKVTKSNPTINIGKTKTLKVKVTFAKNTSLTKAKKAIKVTVGSKVSKSVSYKKNSSKSYTISVKIKGKAAGSATVKVKAKAGTKTAKKGVSWKVTVSAQAKSVTIDNTTPKVGDKLTATVSPSNCKSIQYQWYRADNNTGTKTAIKGATKKTYTVTEADGGYSICVKATAGGKTVESDPTSAVESGVYTKTNNCEYCNAPLGTGQHGADRCYCAVCGAIGEVHGTATCNTHRTCQAGDHSAAACSTAGHYNCDGLTHGGCEHCKAPLCTGQHGADQCYCAACGAIGEIHGTAACKAHRTCQAGDHSEADCGATGHYSCDGLTHGGCSYCDGPECIGEHGLGKCVCEICRGLINDGTHGAAGCGISDHYSCDGKEHSLCEYCGEYLCEGEHGEGKCYTIEKTE